MKSLLVYILLNILLVLGNCQGHVVSQNEDVHHARPSQTEESSTIRSTSDHDRGVAVLSDASNLYRICNTRPQRVLPTYGSQLKRISGRTTTTLLRFVKPFKSFHDRRFRQETAPFCSSVSCIYYIYALRHIIR